ncbi:MAG: sugar phosphate isomerase/epimerase [Pirellulales bacterium]|nr:sugar phosphate isomerase/epimerase [Pirellulales bacterium]
MNEVSTLRWSFDEDIDSYFQAGYRSIGVWRHKLSDFTEDEAVELLASSGLSVSNLSWAGGFTGSDDRSLEESIEDAQEALRLAAALGAQCLVVYSGGRNNHTVRHAARLLRLGLDELLPLAEAIEVPLAIEPVHAGCACDWSFLTDLDAMLDLIGEYPCPYLKVALDTYHFPFQGSLWETLGRVAQHVGIVHLADRAKAPSPEQNRLPLGRGKMPLTEIVAGLQGFGYQGPFDIKLFGPEVECLHYWELLEHSLDTFGKLLPEPAPRLIA